MKNVVQTCAHAKYIEHQCDVRQQRQKIVPNNKSYGSAIKDGKTLCYLVTVTLEVLEENYLIFKNVKCCIKKSFYGTKKDVEHYIISSLQPDICIILII